MHKQLWGRPLFGLPQKRNKGNTYGNKNMLTALLEKDYKDKADNQELSDYVLHNSS